MLNVALCFAICYMQRVIVDAFSFVTFQINTCKVVSICIGNLLEFVADLFGYVGG